RSTDGGLSWAPFSVGIGDRAITSIKLDPQAPGEIDAAATTGVFQLQPGASSWVDLTADLPETIINEVIPAPQGDGLLAATTSGFFRLDDADLTHWTEWKPTPARLVLASPTLGLTYVAGTFGALEATGDDGTTFYPADQGIQNRFVGSLATVNAFGQTVIY